jgi:hypothetical protein
MPLRSWTSLFPQYGMTWTESGDRKARKGTWFRSSPEGETNRGCRGESRTAATDSTARQGFEVDGLRVPALPESASQIEETFALTVTGPHETRQDAMNQRSPEGFVAAAHLAGDAPRPQHLFGVVVGRRYFRIVLAGLFWAGLAIESPAVMTTNPRNGAVVILAEEVATPRPLFRSAPDVEAGVKEQSRQLKNAASCFRKEF